MEYISTHQLEKYENIINQIKSENEKYELLKRNLERENDNMILSQLARAKFTQKLCHLNIQVFNKLVDLLNLYGDELNCDISEMMNFRHHKFYLMEIYITKSLMEKARRLNCMLHIAVESETEGINKTLTLANTFPIREIVPVHKNIMNSIIEVSLILPSEDCGVIIKLDKVTIDISYHFEMYRRKKIQEHPLNNILQINSLYSKCSVKNLLKATKMESKLFCEVEKDFFISTVLKNCYHALDVELFFELKNNENDFVLKLSNGMDTFNIMFNASEKYLKIVADIFNLCLLKKYFHKEFYKNLKIPHSTPSETSNLSLDALELKVNENSIQTSQELCSLYSELRDFWSKPRSKLPI